MNRKIKRLKITMFTLSYLIATVFVSGCKSETKSGEASESATVKKQIEVPKYAEIPKNYAKDIFEIDKEIFLETDTLKLSNLKKLRSELLEYQKIFEDFMLEKELQRSE